MLSTQNIASSYKSCVHPRKAPCPFLCITDGANDIFLQNTVRGRWGKEKHKFSSVHKTDYSSHPDQQVSCIFQCQSMPQTFFPNICFSLTRTEMFLHQGFFWRVFFAGFFFSSSFLTVFVFVRKMDLELHN